MGFGQNTSKVTLLNNEQKQEMIMEFITFKTDFDKQIDNDYQALKKGLTNKVNIENLRASKDNFKKMIDDKIIEITLKNNVSKKDFYSILSEYYKKERQ
jgi:hypothetical protein